MALEWRRAAIQAVPTVELSDDHARVMAQISRLPDGTQVVSVSRVVTGSSAEARALGERLFLEAMNAASSTSTRES